MKSPLRLAHLAWEHGPWVARELVRRGRPQHLVHFYGMTPGDDLMCTAVLREMRLRQMGTTWMMTRFPELFEGNSDVDEVVLFDLRYPRMMEWLGAETHYAHYGGHDHLTDRSPLPARHIIALMCEACGIDGPVTLRPYLNLSASERQFGRFADRQIVLHTSGMSAHSAMKNKEWIPGRMQEVVNALRREFNFVQLGSAADPPLSGCTDLRGKTSMRMSASIIANSTLFLGQVGFLMHLARAVDVPAVIIYGGRELPWQSGYVANTNLTTALPCAPCWRWNACDNPVVRECMLQITVEQVIEAIHDRIARAQEPMMVETSVIPSPTENHFPVLV